MISGETTERGADRNWVSWCLWGELAAAALVYGNSLRNGFALDDYAQIVNNRRIGEWSFFWRSMVNDERWFIDPSHLPQAPFYRPFQNLWFALNYHLFGLNPLGWHAAIVALHLLVVWLVFRVASVLTEDELTGLIAAALFAVMPIHAEAVSWIGAVSTPMGAAFELAAFEFYLRRSETPRNLAFSLLLFGGALLSYDSAVVFPALVAAHAFLLGQHRTYMSYVNDCLRATLFAVWPYFAELAAYLGLRYWVLGFISRPNSFSHLTQTEVLLTAPGALLAYLALLAMPWRAGPAHRLQFVSSPAQARFYLPAAALIALSAAAFLALRRHPHRRLYLFCAAWFLITLGPILRVDLLFVKFAVQDRYLYLPSVAVCIAIADLAAETARQRERIAKAAIIAGAGAAILAGAVILFVAEGYWSGEAAVYARCVEEDPGSDLWRTGLASALLKQQDYAGVRRVLEEEVRLFPYVGENIYYELGLADERTGDRVGAEKALAERVKRLNRPAPEAYADLAVAAAAAGDDARAEAALNQAAALPGGAEIAAATRAQLRGMKDKLKERAASDKAKGGAVTQ